MKKAVALLIVAFVFIGNAIAIDSGSISTDRPLVDRSIERDIAKLIPQPSAAYAETNLLGFQQPVGGIDCTATLIEVANECSASGGALTSFRCDGFSYDFTCSYID